MNSRNSLLCSLLAGGLFAASASMALTLGVPKEGARRAAQATEGFAIYVVRHAEKADTSRDTKLSSSGERHAMALADALGEISLDRVLSTDFHRTRDTAAPTAKAKGLDIEIYDPRSLSELADELRNAGQDALVVGHSNTTPELVERLGGEGRAMSDDEYDVVFMLVFAPSDGASGPATLILSRAFGLPQH